MYRTDLPSLSPCFHVCAASAHIDVLLPFWKGRGKEDRSSSSQYPSVATAIIWSFASGARIMPTSAPEIISIHIYIWIGEDPNAGGKASLPPKVGSGRPFVALIQTTVDIDKHQ